MGIHEYKWGGGDIEASDPEACFYLIAHLLASISRRRSEFSFQALGGPEFFNHDRTTYYSKNTRL